LDSSWLSLITDWDIPATVTGTLLIVGLIYVRGWIAIKYSRPTQIPVWRLVCFLVGLTAISVAVSFSLDTYSETLLFMHMAQHFVLMSVAPPLIVLGCPVVPMLRGLPRIIVRHLGGPIFRSSIAHSLQNLFSRLPFARLAMNLLTLVGIFRKPTSSRCPRKIGTTSNTSAFSRRALSFGGPLCNPGRFHVVVIPGYSFFTY
jgi:putative membrane protein